MGYRIYPCKVYRVERDFKHGGYFNHLSVQVNQMFKEECEDTSWNGNDSIEYADMVFVQKNELAKLIGKFADPDQGQSLMSKYGICKDYTHLDIVKVLAEMLSAADNTNDFVAFVWA